MVVCCPKWQISLISDMGAIMIGVLVFPDFQLLDAAGPISVFEIAAPSVRQRQPRSRVLAVTAGPGRSSSGVEMMARSLRPQVRSRHLIIAGGEGVGAASNATKTLGFRAGRGQTRRSYRQRLLRRLRSGRSGPARRPPRHHALATHPAFPGDLSQGEIGARPHLRSRRRDLEFGRHQRRHRSGAGDGRRRISARRLRRKPRGSLCSIIAAAAGSRNFPRCWN